MKVSIDFDYVPSNQHDADKRLVNWARWVTVRPHGWHTAPMFRQAQSNSRQWHPPEIKDPVNSLDALEVENAVSALPDKHKMALRWFYVYKGSPVAMARALAVSKQGLADLVEAGRTLLKNRIGG
mgnify:FL=1